MTVMEFKTQTAVECLFISKGHGSLTITVSNTWLRMTQMKNATQGFIQTPNWHVKISVHLRNKVRVWNGIWFLYFNGH